MPSMTIVAGLAVLTQPPGLAARGPSADSGRSPGVRVWVSDSTYRIGAGARVFVELREPGYLLVLHADAAGRLRILYPATPTAQPVVPAGEPLEVTAAGQAETFRVEAVGRGTLLAARSAAPFRFDDLRSGDRWDYAEALLLQPTAGHPLAALLDIADRAADGQPFDTDMTEYGTPGAVAARPPFPDSICVGCYARRNNQSGGNAGPSVQLDYSALAVDHSYAASPGGYVVDCSNAMLVDSFCGVQDNRVTTTYDETVITESYSYAYPIYTPFFLPFRRRRFEQAPPPPRPAIALNLRRVPRRLTPSLPPPRRRPPLELRQPTAPSRPRSRVPDPASAAPIPARSLPARLESTARPLPVARLAPDARHRGSTPLVTPGVIYRSPAPAAASMRGAPASRAAARQAVVPSRAVARVTSRSLN